MNFFFENLVSEKLIIKKLRFLKSQKWSTANTIEFQWLSGNKIRTNGEEAIKKLCKGAESTYNKVTAANIDKGFAKATENILAQQAN